METWEIRKSVEKQNPASGCWEIDHYELVGPIVHTGEALANYASAVIRPMDMWNLEVIHRYGEPDEYGVQEFDCEDLADWLNSMTG